MNGKPKKKEFNLIDFAFLLVLVVLIGGFGYKFLSKENGYAAINDTRIESTIVISDVREYTAAAFYIGDLVYERKGPLLGEVTAVSMKPCYKMIENADGSLSYSIDVLKYDVYVTMEVDGKMKDGGCYAGGSRLLAAGTNLMIKSNKVECSAQIFESHEKEDVKKASAA